MMFSLGGSTLKTYDRADRLRECDRDKGETTEEESKTSEHLADVMRHEYMPPCAMSKSPRNRHVIPSLSLRDERIDETFH